MDAESRDRLISLGYEFLKKNAKNNVWVFVNKADQSFDMPNIPCVISDILTF